MVELLVIFSMAVHGVESLIDRKRSVAALAALGASAKDLEAAADLLGAAVPDARMVA